VRVNVEERGEVDVVRLGFDRSSELSFVDRRLDM
jgi:hypothetical protein